MNITAIETIRTAEFPNLLWVQVHTDAGLIGLPPVVKGEITVPPGPGLGLALQPDLSARKDTTVRRATVKDL